MKCWTRASSLSLNAVISVPCVPTVMVRAAIMKWMMMDALRQNALIPITQMGAATAMEETDGRDASARTDGLQWKLEKWPMMVTGICTSSIPAVRAEARQMVRAATSIQRAIQIPVQICIRIAGLDSLTMILGTDAHAIMD